MSLANLNCWWSAGLRAAVYPGASPSVREEASGQTEAVSRRYGFIDLLRGFALLVMIETHVVTAYLPTALKKAYPTFFFGLSFMNGLVAPGFLFAAGFSLLLQGNSQWESWVRLRAPFWKQMRRLGFIVLVAYYTHLQGFSLSRYLSHWNDSLMWNRSLKVDVLQCIVASLLAVHLLILILRRKEWLPWAIAILATGAALATPWMWAQDFRQELPLSIALFLNPHGYSLFPLFPWICFVLAGSFVSCLFLQAAKNGDLSRFMRNVALAGILMIAAGLFLRKMPYTLPGYENFYATSPLYMMIRIGCILLISALLYGLETGGNWVPRPIQIAGQESLLVYGVHLWIIYALLRGKHLSRIIGLQSGYLGCFAISIAIILAMLVLAKHWHALKKNYPIPAKVGQAAATVAMIAVFVLA